MSQQQKLEKVLDLLLSEDSDQAAELLHQIIVEKARTIYESIVEEEGDDVEELDEASDDEVGGEPSEDFTDEIASDEDEVESDEENDGEASDDEMDDEGDDDFGGEDMSTEDRVEDLESQLADLRAEFDQLMGEEMMEPNHADMAVDMEDGEFDGEMDVEPADDMPDFGSDGEQKVVGEVVATMFEKKKKPELKVAPQAKKMPKGKDGKKVAEETQFLSKVADTGQTGTAKLVGTGKDTPHGAENTKAPFTSAPSKKDYGGGPVKMGSGTGGEYGKYHGDSAKKESASDNVNVKPKNSGIKADTTAKYTGGKAAGEGFSKSPFTKKPS